MAYSTALLGSRKQKWPTVQHFWAPGGKSGLQYSTFGLPEAKVAYSTALLGLRRQKWTTVQHFWASGSKSGLQYSRVWFLSRARSEPPAYSRFWFLSKAHSRRQRSLSRSLRAAPAKVAHSTALLGSRRQTWPTVQHFWAPGSKSGLQYSTSGRPEANVAYSTALLATSSLLPAARIQGSAAVA